VISLEDLILLVDSRSRLMNSAKKGSMSAIIGLGEEKIQSILEEASASGIIVVANYNSPSQIVISGDDAAVNYASLSAKKAGAVVRPLAVSGAFHSPMMKDLIPPFKAFLDKIHFNNAAFPVITNVDAVSTRSGYAFKRKLVKQLSSPILWKQSIELMVNKGVGTFIEIGPQQVLSNLLRRWLPELTVYSIYDLPSLDSTISSL
jgi:[acyl-carrier-protein] S-malonyltransferase